MYKKDFVVVIKCNGQILREIENVVTLPFGSEYSILLKNLNSRKAQVSISIDGKDVLDDKKLVIDGNKEKETELKGYMNGFSAKNKFKFIKKTKEIMEHRGDRIDDGIIRVEYQFEKKIVTQRVRTEYTSLHYNDPVIIYNSTPKPDFFDQDINICSNSVRGINGDGSGSVFYSNNSNIEASMSSDFDTLRSRKICKSKKMSNPIHNSKFKNFVDNDSTPQPLEDEGITVKGSRINQQFREVFMGELEEQSSVITLKLRGYNGKQEMVYKPITVKTRLVCETCGKGSKSNAKFCSNCGTSLI